ncbi:MAG: phosphoenolpyruvate carboxykinase (ATP), partial [Planctomycetota bacterium]
MTMIQNELGKLLNLSGVTYHHDLGKEQLFRAALENDRGRIRPDGPDDEHKAYQTALGVDGPLVFYTDPTCTGRPVQDTFAVAWPELEESLWWKKDFQRYDPRAYEGLRERVVEHLNAKGAELYVQDVYCGTDSDYAIPFRFVGEYATHAMFVHNMFPKEFPGEISNADAKRFTL